MKRARSFDDGNGDDFGMGDDPEEEEEWDALTPLFGWAAQKAGKELVMDVPSSPLFKVHEEPLVRPTLAAAPVPAIVKVGHVDHDNDSDSDAADDAAKADEENRVLRQREVSASKSRKRLQRSSNARHAALKSAFAKTDGGHPPTHWMCMWSTGVHALQDCVCLVGRSSGKVYKKALTRKLSEFIWKTGLSSAKTLQQDRIRQQCENMVGSGSGGGVSDGGSNGGGMADLYKTVPSCSRCCGGVRDLPAVDNEACTPDAVAQGRAAYAAKASAAVVIPGPVTRALASVTVPDVPPATLSQAKSTQGCIARLCKAATADGFPATHWLCATGSQIHADAYCSVLRHKTAIIPVPLSRAVRVFLAANGFVKPGLSPSLLPACLACCGVSTLEILESGPAASAAATGLAAVAGGPTIVPIFMDARWVAFQRSRNEGHPSAHFWPVAKRRVMEPDNVVVTVQDLLLPADGSFLLPQAVVTTIVRVLSGRVHADVTPALFSVFVRQLFSSERQAVVQWVRHCELARAVMCTGADAYETLQLVTTYGIPRRPWSCHICIVEAKCQATGARSQHRCLHLSELALAWLVVHLNEEARLAFRDRAEYTDHVNLLAYAAAMFKAVPRGFARAAPGWLLAHANSPPNETRASKVFKDTLAAFGLTVKVTGVHRDRIEVFDSHAHAHAH